MWSDDSFRFFVKEAMLNETEIYILDSRIKGTPISKQADKLGYSIDNVNKIIKQMKNKYDFIQKKNPDILPLRRKSSSETYMDTH